MGRKELEGDVVWSITMILYDAMLCYSSHGAPLWGIPVHRPGHVTHHFSWAGGRGGRRFGSLSCHVCVGVCVMYVRRMCGCNCASTGREMILLHLCTAFTDPTNAACLYTGRDGVR